MCSNILIRIKIGNSAKRANNSLDWNQIITFNDVQYFSEMCISKLMLAEILNKKRSGICKSNKKVVEKEREDAFLLYCCTIKEKEK